TSEATIYGDPYESPILLVAPRQSIDLAALTLRGAPGSAVAVHDRRIELARRRGRGEIGICRRSNGRTHALEQQLLGLQDLVEPVNAHAHLVANLHRMRGLHRLTIGAHMPATDRRRRRRASLIDAHGPQPHIATHGARFGHAPIVAHPSLAG